MLSRRAECTKLIACALVAVLAAPGAAFALPGLIQEQEGDVLYITGGVGEREREALNNMQNAYNLFAIMALETGAYLAHVHVILRDASGQTVLETESRGPFLLARVPPGRYELEARAGEDRTEVITVDVAGGEVERAFLTFPRAQP